MTTAPIPVPALAFRLTSSRRALLRAAGLTALVGALATGFVAQTFAGPTPRERDAAVQGARADAALKACACS